MVRESGGFAVGSFGESMGISYVCYTYGVRGFHSLGVSIMATVLSAFYSVGASGKVGPLVAVIGRRGGGLRMRANRCDQRSPLQTWNRRQAFSYSQYLWNATSDANREQWQEFALRWSDVRVAGTRGSLTGRMWFLRFAIRAHRYGGFGVMAPPVSPCCAYCPDLEVTWTVSGARLTWSPAIGTGERIVVRQARNERIARMRPVRGVVSHIFEMGDTSPQLITGGVGGAGGPGDLPPIAGMTSLHVHVEAMDLYCRFTPRRYWRLLPS